MGDATLAELNHACDAAYSATTENHSAAYATAGACGDCARHPRPSGYASSAAVAYYSCYHVFASVSAADAAEENERLWQLARAVELAKEEKRG